MAEVQRILGCAPGGSTHARLKSLIAEWNLDTSHFTGQGWSKGLRRSPRRPPEDYLVQLPAGARRVRCGPLTRALVATGREYRCEWCGNDGTWEGLAITLHVDHVSGDWRDCRASNLRFLCPNCHSQTSTHSRGLGRTARTAGAEGGSRTRTPEGTAS